MYLRFTKARQKTYLVVVEGYRDGSKVKQRTVCNLGPINASDNKSDILALGKKILVEFGGESLVDGSELCEESRSNFGVYEILQKLWEKYSLDQLFHKLLSDRKIQYDLTSALKLMIAGRLINPTSKLALFGKKESYLGLSNVKLSDLYKSLDELYKYQDQINSHLFDAQEKLHGTASITLFDVTTLYFESKKADDLREFGYSKDCKFNEVQIVLSLITSASGIPIACELFRGNTSEGSTIISFVAKLKTKYKIDKVVVVADRGLYKRENLETMQSLGFEYVIGTRLRNSKAEIKNEVFKDNGYKITKDKRDDSYKFKYKLIQNKVSDNHIENIIISWSEKRAIKDKNDRLRLIEKAKDLLETNITSDKRGAKKYIKTTKTNAHLNEEKIALDEKWDGYYAISTNANNLSEEEVIGSYHDLWKIEDSFRLMKSHFEARPMFHWTTKRIHGHIMLNFIAMVFERHMESILQPEQAETKEPSAKVNKQTQISPARIRAAINKMQRSVIKVNNTRYCSYANPCDLGQLLLIKLDIKARKSAKFEMI